MTKVSVLFFLVEQISARSAKHALLVDVDACIDLLTKTTVTDEEVEDMCYYSPLKKVIDMGNVESMNVYRVAAGRSEIELPVFVTTSDPGSTPTTTIQDRTTGEFTEAYRSPVLVAVEDCIDLLRKTTVTDEEVYQKCYYSPLYKVMDIGNVASMNMYRMSAGRSKIVVEPEFSELTTTADPTTTSDPTTMEEHLESLTTTSNSSCTSWFNC